jgi:hypothetical protein
VSLREKWSLWGCFIQGFAQYLAGLKGQNPAGGDLDLLASLGISPLAGSFLPDDEVSKTGDLDFIPDLQGLFQEIENQIHNFRRFFPGKADFFVNHLDDVCFCHETPPFKVDGIAKNPPLAAEITRGRVADKENA